MNKQKKQIAIIIGSVFVLIAVLSVSTVMILGQSAPEVVEAPEYEFSIPEGGPPKPKESSTPSGELADAYKIKPRSSASKAAGGEVIEDPAARNPKDSVPPPAITETTDPDGGTVQTPNWAAQKELAPGTDLNDPDKQPEYANSSSSKSAASSQSSSPASGSSSSKEAAGSSTAPAADNKSGSSNAGGNTGSTPKNGDTKTINGEEYGYVEGFGWVKKGNGGTTRTIEAPTTGNKVGH